MPDQPRSALSTFFTMLWKTVDLTRKVVLNLVFLLLLALFIAAVLDMGDGLIVQPQTALVLDPQGEVVEQYSGTPLDQALQRATDIRSETRLRDLLDAIGRARDDDRIVRMVIDPGYATGIGLASLHELEAAVADFKTSGKPVVALAENLGEQQYYLAALADEIWLHPGGQIWIDGFAVYRNYLRDALDKLEVEVNLFRVGEYKSAAEPFVQNQMSDEDREANLFWLGSLWQQYLETISRQRGVPLVDLSEAVNGLADRLEAAGGDFAELALDLGLVDRIVSRAEAEQELARLGAPGDDQHGYRQVAFHDYLNRTRLRDIPQSRNRVAVVVAEGEIVRGRQPSGAIGADTLSELLAEAAREEAVKAVVLRLNSPGGDPFASERIRLELRALAEQGKTVVVSMGDVAASGGYWIALGAQEMWASPATLTGSIGVFGLLPTFSETLDNLGIHTDGVGTTPLAGRLRLDLPLDQDLKRVYQMSVDDTYRDFIALVSAARGLTTSEADQVARGRVWSGLQARDRRLVDQIGTLRNAIDSAARIAGLGSDYEVQYLEPAPSTLESFLLDMTASAVARMGGTRAMLSWQDVAVLDNLLAELRLLVRSNGGFTIAAHCLCRAP